MEKKKRKKSERFPASELRETYREQARLMRYDLRTLSQCQQRVFLLCATARHHKCSVETVRNKVPYYKHMTLTRKYL